MKRRLNEQPNGFTIIELLIATTVFTLVLILLTTGTLAVSRLYYKGIISAQTQTATRNVLNDVTQSLQFSGANFVPLAASNGTDGFCVGSDQFSYQLDKEVTDTASPQHALLETNVGNNCSTSILITTPAASPAPTSTELLSAHMRLNNLDVTPVSSTLYCVSIRIIYGDDDLLTSPPATEPTDYCGNAYQQYQQCNGAFGNLIGGQFCAVSELDTYIQQRVLP